ncbi:hypothetical protein LNAOJCKE_4479 [Methylorubrum aminovorans]|uniref:Uncharacterized protein n=1 Tax=Methylorubrum aminovorans TaxID=269069 RepID=A0ABQ4UJD0_9HYPH|nr:hypothetical protein LNAOJCKE_4479 [Methylorubrum aminovorans]
MRATQSDSAYVADDTEIASAVSDCKTRFGRDLLICGLESEYKISIAQKNQETRIYLV